MTVRISGRCRPVVLTAFFILLFCTTVAFAAGKSQPSLSRSSLTIVQYRTVRLKVKGTTKTPKWSCSDDDIAEVEPSGKVTGLSSGKCVVTATIGKIKKRCTVIVVPATSQNLSDFYLVSSNKGKILLAGSSSISRWTGAENAFGKYGTVNVGIGGSLVTEWMELYKKLILPYKPKAIVFYCGTNDIAHGAGGITNAKRTISLFQQIHQKLKGVPIFYVSICSTPSRKENMIECAISNERMEAFCEKTGYAHYIDLASAFLRKDGMPSRAFFEDGQHPNKTGYQKWKEIICSAVLQVLDKKG